MHSGILSDIAWFGRKAWRADVCSNLIARCRRVYCHTDYGSVGSQAITGTQDRFRRRLAGHSGISALARDQRQRGIFRDARWRTGARSVASPASPYCISLALVRLPHQRPPRVDHRRRRFSSWARCTATISQPTMSRRTCVWVCATTMSPK